MSNISIFKGRDFLKLLDFTPEEIGAFLDLAAELNTDQLRALADTLEEKKVVIATEVGGGVVPIDPAQRQSREAAGRLACLLAERADTVIRVCCGLPRFLKGGETIKENRGSANKGLL